MTVALLILGLLLFIGLVVLHEFGHFIVAKRNGVTPEEFGIGFPPRLWARRAKGGYEFSVNLLPLGGFVRLKGEHDADISPGSFGRASLWSKTKIMLAGIGLNLVAAFVILTLVALIGIPQIITKDSVGENQFTVARDTKIIQNDVLISYVESNSPASHIGLQTGDQLISVAGTKVTTSTQLPTLTKARPGQTVAITYKHSNEIKQTDVTLRTQQVVQASLKTSSPKGYLGISPVDYTVQRNTWSAPVVAGGLIGQLTRLTLKGLWSAIRGLGSLIAGVFTGNKVARQNGQTEATNQVGGPVAIFVILKEGATRGLSFILFLIGYISLILAIMNLLPVPALDGGRFYMVLISRKIFGRPLPKRTEERIVGSSFAVLMLLFVLLTVVDVRRFF